jgi:hypothetical protein
MAVRSVINQYRGINAHLHSYWQAAGGWNNFHNRHIDDLAGWLRQSLLPMGYTAIMEHSLQIRRWHSDEGRTLRADIAISDLQPGPRLGVGTSSEQQLTVADMVTEIEVEKPYMALAIYPLSRESGEPVAWLELLSPANKGQGRDAQSYLSKRDPTFRLIRRGLPGGWSRCWQRPTAALIWRPGHFRSKNLILTLLSNRLRRSPKDRR